MDQSLSWLDPNELSQALVRAGLAGVPATRRSAAPRPAGFRPLEPRRPLPSRAADGGAEVAPFEPPEGTLQTRLKSFLLWVLDLTGCRRIFVVDEEGLVLMERDADPVLVALATPFLSLLERIHSCLEETTTQSSIAIDLEAGQVLHLVQVESSLGRYALGFVVTQPIRRQLVRCFQEGLSRVMSETN
jgi:hypothetical protein